MTTTSTSQTSGKRAIKRKLDESVLKKARVALGLPLESKEEDNEGDQQHDEPSLKWRKPRHNTAEGQLYMQNKEKRKLEEEKTLKSSRLSSTKQNKEDNKKSKQKRKAKKKKKKTDDGGGTSVEISKNPESEKRHAMEAISYLQLWAANRDHWKFEKRKQTWLLKNCLDANLIDDKRFTMLLEYIASVKGSARQATLDEMHSVVKTNEMLGGSSSKTVDIQSEESERSINDVKYDRARQVIQMLVD